MKTTSKLSMTLLPKFPGLKLEDIFIEAGTVSLRVASTHPTGVSGLRMRKQQAT